MCLQHFPHDKPMVIFQNAQVPLTPQSLIIGYQWTTLAVYINFSNTQGAVNFAHRNGIWSKFELRHLRYFGCPCNLLAKIRYKIVQKLF